MDAMSIMPGLTSAFTLVPVSRSMISPKAVMYLATTFCLRPGGSLSMTSSHRFTRRSIESYIPMLYANLSGGSAECYADFT